MTPMREAYINADLTIAFGPGQASELADATHIHDQLVKFLLSVPSAIIKNPDEIIEERFFISQPRTQTLLAYPLNALLRRRRYEEFKEFMGSQDLLSTHIQKKHSEQMAPLHASLKDNFPPANFRQV